MLNTRNIAQLVHWKEFRQNCAAPGCHTTVLRHSLLGRRAGVRIGGDWYCGPDCLREGITERVYQLREASLELVPRRTARIPLGLLLVTRGCITQRQLDAALTHQQQHGGTVGDALCTLRFATERQVAEAAATQWGCPFFDARPQLADIRAHIPATLMRLANMAPVHFATTLNKMLVGFVYGVEHRVLRTIEQMTGWLAEPCFITASDCSQNIRTLAGRHIEVSFGATESTAEIANIAQSYAGQIGADEARLARCLDVIWVRLARDGHPTDLLFALTDSAQREIGCSDYCALN